MSSSFHRAIYFTLSASKEDFIQQLVTDRAAHPLHFLNSGHGLFFTNEVLQEYLLEERRHEQFFVTPANGISLVTSSDGEQKKALLHHLLAKSPDYLVVDDIFDNLDKLARAEIINLLTAYSEKTIIIQLFGRRNDRLPFIDTLMLWKDHQLVTVTEAELPVSTFSPSEITVFPPPLEPRLPLNDPLVSFTDVNVYYDERCILHNINWTINKNEYWELSGPNGAGKTTLLSMINGDNTKAYGQNIKLFGYQKGSGESIWDIKKHIGYFSQHMIRFFERPDSAVNMIAGGLSDSVGLYEKLGDQVMNHALDWLQALGLYSKKDKPFIQFSPAHQRMILLARAMIKHPPLLILDEPTAGLNDTDSALVISLINQLASETASAIMVVSHRREEGLTPSHLFELHPGKNGSTGKASVNRAAKTKA